MYNNKDETRNSRAGLFSADFAFSVEIRGGQISTQTGVIA